MTTHYHKCLGCGEEIPMRKEYCVVCADKRREERHYEFMKIYKKRNDTKTKISG